jgi:hypothetical protein
MTDDKLPIPPNCPFFIKNETPQKEIFLEFILPEKGLNPMSWPIHPKNAAAPYVAMAGQLYWRKVKDEVIKNNKSAPLELLVKKINEVQEKIKFWEDWQNANN